LHKCGHPTPSDGRFHFTSAAIRTPSDGRFRCTPAAIRIPPDGRFLFTPSVSEPQRMAAFIGWRRPRLTKRLAVSRYACDLPNPLGWPRSWLAYHRPNRMLGRFQFLLRSSEPQWVVAFLAYAPPVEPTGWPFPGFLRSSEADRMAAFLGCHRHAESKGPSFPGLLVVFRISMTGRFVWFPPNGGIQGTVVVGSACGLPNPNGGPRSWLALRRPNPKAGRFKECLRSSEPQGRAAFLPCSPPTEPKEWTFPILPAVLRTPTNGRVLGLPTTGRTQRLAVSRCLFRTSESQRLAAFLVFADRPNPRAGCFQVCLLSCEPQRTAAF
jgi:hypothetical protein